jgi:hypothetical protein
MIDIKCMAVLTALSDVNRLRIAWLLLKEHLGVHGITLRPIGAFIQ